MLATPTLDKLHALKLPALAQAWQEQQQTADLAALSFVERLGLLVDAEWLARDNKRLARALQEAKLKLPHACIEAIDYPARCELDKAVIRQLATCRWIDEHQQVLVTGATGTGKSFVACALANQACRRGYRAYYRRISRLFEDLRLARADGTYGRLLGKLARLDVLLLDDWGLAPPQDQERRDLLEILEDRYGSRSTIITSQHPLTEKGGQARQLSDRPASLRSDHDPRSPRSRWTDLGVHDRRYTHQVDAQARHDPWLELWPGSGHKLCRIRPTRRCPESAPRCGPPRCQEARGQVLRHPGLGAPGLPPARPDIVSGLLVLRASPRSIPSTGSHPLRSCSSSCTFGALPACLLLRPRASFYCHLPFYCRLPLLLLLLPPASFYCQPTSLFGLPSYTLIELHRVPEGNELRGSFCWYARIKSPRVSAQEGERMRLAVVSSPRSRSHPSRQRPSLSWRR